VEYSQQILSPEILAEQKAYKASKDSFRAAIKILSEEQPLLKNQRKTVTKKIQMATIELPSYVSAAALFHRNRVILRHLHIAYAIFRGKPMPETRWNLINDKFECILPWPAEKFLTSPNYKLVEKYLTEHVRETVHPYQG
jgi:hypothetical protein